MMISLNPNSFLHAMAISSAKAPAIPAIGPTPVIKEQSDKFRISSGAVYGTLRGAIACSNSGAIKK